MYNRNMEQLAMAVNISSWEIILILFIVGGGFLLGVLIGKSRIFILLLGVYVSFAIMSVVPFSKILPNVFERKENFVIFIVIFLVLIALIYFLFSRSLLKSLIRKKDNRSIFHIFFLSLFLIGIVISVIFSYLPKDLISQFSLLILKIFNTSLSRTLWLIIPIIFIGLFKRKKQER